MYARERRRQEQLPHGRENVYQYRDTEPQPRDGAPRSKRRLDLSGQADGPNGGMPPRPADRGVGWPSMVPDEAETRRSAASRMRVLNLS